MKRLSLLFALLLSVHASAATLARKVVVYDVDPAAGTSTTFELLSPWGPPWYPASIDLCPGFTLIAAEGGAQIIPLSAIPSWVHTCGARPFVADAPAHGRAWTTIKRATGPQWHVPALDYALDTPATDSARVGPIQESGAADDTVLVLFNDSATEANLQYELWDEDGGFISSGDLTDIAGHQHVILMPDELPPLQPGAVGTTGTLRISYRTGAAAAKVVGFIVNGAIVHPLEAEESQGGVQDH